MYLNSLNYLLSGFNQYFDFSTMEAMLSRRSPKSNSFISLRAEMKQYKSLVLAFIELIMKVLKMKSHNNSF